MLSFRKDKSIKAGLPPGSYVFLGDKIEEEVKISLFLYANGHYLEKTIEKPEEIKSFMNKDSVLWVNVDGLQDVTTIEKICNLFKIHPLTIEDILNTTQRPKIEDNEDYLFIVLKSMDFDKAELTVKMEQLSLILGENFVLSFQEQAGDEFDSVRNRIRTAKGFVRKSGADYLLYALMDTIVDNYFVILEKMGDHIEHTEVALLEDAHEENLRDLYKFKRETLAVRRAVWPLREVLHKIEKEEYWLIKKETSVFLRDIYDHSIRVIDTVETYRDMLSGMLDLYQSTMSNRMNAVMKVLTIISTIFIPLTFISSIYGMNFKHFPELEWEHGYPMFYVVCVSMVVIMLWVFKRKKWI